MTQRIGALSGLELVITGGGRGEGRGGRGERRGGRGKGKGGETNGHIIIVSIM